MLPGEEEVLDEKRGTDKAHLVTLLLETRKR